MAHALQLWIGGRKCDGAKKKPTRRSPGFEDGQLSGAAAIDIGSTMHMAAVNPEVGRICR